MSTIKQLWLQIRTPARSSKIPYTDLNFFIKFYTNSLWQIFLDFCDRNILYSIQPYNNSLNRQDKTIVKTSFQEYVKGIQHLLIRTSYRGSNSRNAYFATAHLLYKTFFQSVHTHAFPARNCDLFTMLDVHVLLQFLQDCKFKFKGFIRIHVLRNFCHIRYLLIFISVGWDVKG